MYLVTAYYPNYISHHGILGQKWGIRRYQNTDGTYTAEGKARRAGLFTQDARKLAAKATKKNSSGNYRNYLTNKYSAKLYKDEVVIRAGTKVERVTLKSKDAGDATYVVVQGDKMGRKYYDTEWPRYLQNLKNNKDPDSVQVYRDVYKVKTDIIAPDQKTRKEALKAILEADKSLYEEIGSITAKRYFKEEVAEMKEETPNYKADIVYKKTGNEDAYFKEIDRLTDQKYWDSLQSTRMGSYESAVKEAPKVYRDYMNALNEAQEVTSRKVTLKEAKKWTDEKIKEYDNYAKRIENNPNAALNKVYATIPTSPRLMQAYAKELNKRGFNAAYDENTALVSSAPFIVFDKNTLEFESSKNITKEANAWNRGETSKLPS